MKLQNAFDLGGAAMMVGILAIISAPLAFSQTHEMSHEDSAFLKDAAQGGMDEVKLGELSQQHAVNDRVKKFGQRMIDDHTKMGHEVQALASRKNVSLPADIGILQSASYKMLAAKSGESFDKSYISSMVKDHEDDIAAFEKEANHGADPDVKALAMNALPTLREHLRMAQDIARELGVK